MHLEQFNCKIYDKELLAIVKALEEGAAELVNLQRSGRFDILSDHRALEYLRKPENLTRDKPDGVDSYHNSEFSSDTAWEAEHQCRFICS